ncbi:MAG: hypothetical protein WD226_10030 [Planctomycetota bacterium]
MTLSKRFASLLAAALLAGAASAQGATCATAAPIAGTGAFNFSTLGATNDGPSACGNIGADVWYSWTAPTADTYVFSTCSAASYDTVLVAYTACGGGQLACNDDSGCTAFRSTIQFPTQAGNTYLIRIGGYQNATGTGTLEISAGGSTGGCGSPATGPDVIVGDLTGPSNYSGVGGIGAYSIGTTSCNVGTAELLWQASNPNHPVIGQNIYRHEGNRFELLGISYLKHGFTALQQNLCCPCNSSGTGSRLGVGCSDPYGSGLNGSQSGLGPRWQVNAHTGAFAYPYSQQSQTGNSIFKRIQVKNTDLDPSLHPTATIVGEGQYIAPDDAAAGNGNNNVAWRQMNVGGFSSGRWDLSFSGITHREDPAIRAWAVFDPSVQLTDVQVPNEGLFIVGNKATDNGDGTWNYEYAVYNMNSHASGGSFSVPVPPGVTVTNIGFHDVDYHSGEPFSGTDWTGVRGANDVSWATQTFAANSNANAIRWGTLYNFRFDADAAPNAVNATLGMFRPHTPSSVSVAVRGPECGSVLASETVRSGSPANANALLPGVTSRPLTGSTWDPVIDHTSFYTDATIDFLAVNPDGAAINVPLALGTLLCNVPSSDFLFFGAPGAPFAVSIPSTCSLVGRPVCTQGGSLGGSLGIQLTNALDLVLGNQ